MKRIKARTKVIPKFRENEQINIFLSFSLLNIEI